MKTTNLLRFARGHRFGFTIVELLVVIAIVGLLVTMVLPALTASRAVARDLLCKVNLRSYSDAIYMYQSTYKGYYPPSWDYSLGNSMKTWNGTYLVDFMNVRAANPACLGAGFDYETSTIKCPEDNESGRQYSGYALVDIGAGFYRNYLASNWVGSGIVASDGNPGLFSASAAGDGSAGNPRYPGYTNVDPASPYIVEFICTLPGGVAQAAVAYDSGGAVNATQSMRLRHGTLRAASGLGNRMNYVSTDLSVLTVDFSSVSDANLTANLTSSINWYEVGAYAGYQTINGYSGENLNPYWPYGTGISTTRKGLLTQ